MTWNTCREFREAMSGRLSSNQAKGNQEYAFKIRTVGPWTYARSRLVFSGLLGLKGADVSQGLFCRQLDRPCERLKSDASPSRSITRTSLKCRIRARACSNAQGHCSSPAQPFD